MGVLIFGWCDSEFNKMSLVDHWISELFIGDLIYDFRLQAVYSVKYMK